MRREPMPWHPIGLTCESKADVSSLLHSPHRLQYNLKILRAVHTKNCSIGLRIFVTLDVRETKTGEVLFLVEIWAKLRLLKSFLHFMFAKSFRKRDFLFPRISGKGDRFVIGRSQVQITLTLVLRLLFCALVLKMRIGKRQSRYKFWRSHWANEGSFVDTVFVCLF